MVDVPKVQSVTKLGRKASTVSGLVVGQQSIAYGGLPYTIAAARTNGRSTPASRVDNRFWWTGSAAHQAGRHPRTGSGPSLTCPEFTAKQLRHLAVLPPFPRPATCQPEGLLFLS